MEYRLVTYREDGVTIDYDIAFEADSDAEANAWAEEEARGTLWQDDWYLLDHLGRNINE